MGSGGGGVAGAERGQTERLAKEAGPRGLRRRRSRRMDGGESEDEDEGDALPGRSEATRR